MYNLEFNGLTSNQYQTFKSQNQNKWDGRIHYKKKKSNTCSQVYKNQIQIYALSCNHRKPNYNVHAHLQTPKLQLTTYKTLVGLVNN